jgi:hypothetical protein
MTVPVAVDVWKQYMEPAKALKQLMYLGSPAVTNGADPMGLTWLSKFLDGCDGCHIDFICIHWYVFPSSPFPPYPSPSSPPHHLFTLPDLTDARSRYDDATSIDYFKSHINAARDMSGGRPIWITELGPRGTDAEIKNFLRVIIPWLEASAVVHRYAYFMARPGFLINQAGDGMSEAGRVWATL